MIVKNVFFVLTIITLFGCYTSPEIPGLNKDLWLAEIISCDDSKVSMAELIVDNDEFILGSGQAIIKQLLGQPSENELYNRNQKFFHYNITAGDSCTNIEKQLRLSIRFDALDRAKEVLILQE